MTTGTAAVAAALALGAVATVAGATRSAAAFPDVTRLIIRAKAKVRSVKAFSRAILLEAGGTTGGRRVKTAAGIKRWRFVFDNQATPHFRFRSVYVNYAGGWGRVVGVREEFDEDLRIRFVPKMTLPRAIAGLRAAGYRSGFFTVVLRRPLTSDNRYKHPLYIFGVGRTGPYIGVDTVTRRIVKIS